MIILRPPSLRYDLPRIHFDVSYGRNLDGRLTTSPGAFYLLFSILVGRLLLSGDLATFLLAPAFVLCEWGGSPDPFLAPGLNLIALVMSLTSKTQPNAVYRKAYVTIYT